MSLLKAFGWFWWDLLIGDDWRIAAYVATLLTLDAGLAASGAPDAVVAIGALVGLVLCFALFVAREARR
jgi:hypothetical protein